MNNEVRMKAKCKIRVSVAEIIPQIKNSDFVAAK